MKAYVGIVGISKPYTVLMCIHNISVYTWKIFFPSFFNSISYYYNYYYELTFHKITMYLVTIPSSNYLIGNDFYSSCPLKKERKLEHF